MVLALALPADFAHKELIVTMTFGVVVLSILIQGLTMAPLLRRLGLSRSLDHRAEYEERRAELLAASAALAELDRMEAEPATSTEIVATLRAEYRERLERARSSLASVQLSRAEIRAEEEEAARRRLLLSEKEAILDATRRGKVPTEIGARVGAAVDARLVELDQEEPAAEESEASAVGDVKTAKEPGSNDGEPSS
jgi:CPA1 family monovalent cation:H+ antiporter